MVKFDESSIGVMVDMISSHIRFKRKESRPEVVELKLPREFVVSKIYNGLSERNLPAGQAETGELIRIDFNTNRVMPDTSDISHFLKDLVIPRLEGVGKIAVEDTPNGIVILAADTMSKSLLEKMEEAIRRPVPYEGLRIDPIHSRNLR